MIAALLAAYVGLMTYALVSWRRGKVRSRRIATITGHKPFLPADTSEMTGTAYHEAGHALLVWHSPYVYVITNAQIDTMGGVVNYRMVKPATETALWTELTVKLAGLAGEVIASGRLKSMGAEGDLGRARELATEIFEEYGDREVRRRLAKLTVESSIDIGALFRNPLRPEVRMILNAAFLAAKEHLIEFEAPFRRIAVALLERRRLSHDDLRKILGPRPWSRFQ